MKQSFLFFLFFFLFLLRPLATSAQGDLNGVREEYKDRIAKTMKKKNVMGATVAMVSSQGVLWIDNFGFADTENEQPVTAETLFGIGSVTKVFTSTAVMQLAERGQIELDSPLKDYLASFQMKDDNGGVTPRNVLTHHSGLPSDIFKGMFSRQPEDYKCVVSYINQEYMAGIPNQIRAYSNPGYSLLGHMIAEVSGSEYPEYIQQNILQPLGMSSTRFNAIEIASKAYDKKGHLQQDVNVRDIPAGGLFSSSGDMSKFLQAYLSQSQRLLQKETFIQLLEQQHKDAELNFSNRYALGWNMASRPHAGDIYTHTGTMLYFNAAIAFSPKADVGVIVLTNSERGGTLFHIVNSIIDEIAKRKGLPKEEKPLIELGSKKRLERSASALDDYVGIYAAPGVYIDVFRKRKKLFMKLQGMRLELIPVANNQFIPKAVLLRLIPIRLGDQRVSFENIAGYPVMTNIEEGSDKELIAQKLEKQTIPKAWLARTGDYELVNPLPGEIPYFTDFKVVEESNLLVLSFRTVSGGQNIEMVLDIINENRAKVAGLGRYGGQAITCHDGIITAFGYQLTKTHE